MLASPGSRYCPTHSRHDKLDAAVVAAELTEAANTLESPEDVNRLLSKTLLAFIAGRIPHKKAGMIGFLGQIILRTHREIVFHQNVDRDNHPENYHLFPDEYCEESNSTTGAPVAPEPTNTPPPEIVAPEKIPDLSHFYPNDPTLDPRFHAYNPIPYIPAERQDDPVWPGEPPPATNAIRNRSLPYRRHHRSQ